VVLLSVWFDGIQSNLLAELIGLIASIIATYLIVDKIIDANRRRHHRPLRELLRRVTGQSLAAISHFWAYQMGLVTVRDLQAAIEAELADRVSGYTDIIETRLFALDGAAERQRFCEQHEPRVIMEIARQTIEDFGAIAYVSAQVQEVVQEDERLESLIANLEAATRTLAHVYNFAVYLRDFETAPELPLALLISRSVRCYRQGLEVWQHLNGQDRK
jgi:hypothetical protein